MPMMNTRLLLIILCVLSTPVFARPQLKIIPLQHRLAEEMAPTLQALVGPGSSVNAYGSQIIVNAEPSEIANIEETIRQLDVERRTWRISVNNDNQDWQQNRHIGASGSAGNGSVRVLIPDGRGRVIHDGVTVTADDREIRRSQTGGMTLNTLDGAPAYISVGQLVPYSGYWVDLTNRYARGVQTTGWQEVATGFTVKPRQVGDKVDVEITPRVAQPGGNGAIDFTALSTHVQVRPGEWVDLGGALGNRDEVSRAILGQGSERGSRSNNLRIKIE